MEQDGTDDFSSNLMIYMTLPFPPILLKKEKLRRGRSAPPTLWFSPWMWIFHLLLLLPWPSVVQGVCLPSAKMSLEYFWYFGCIILGVDVLKYGMEFEGGIHWFLAPFCTCFVAFYVGEGEAQVVVCNNCRVWYVSVCNMLLCGWIQNAVFLVYGS